MEAYPLHDVKRHLVIQVDGLTVLLDTGSPVSVGRRNPLPIVGLSRDPGPPDSPLLEQISAWLGRWVDWIAGVDVLSAAPVLVDGPNRMVTFGAPAIEGAGMPLAIDLRHSVPEVPIRHAGTPAAAFLDTGAPISYAPPAAVIGREPDGCGTDLFPHFGPFTTPLYALEVFVGDRRVRGRFGVLPTQLMSRVIPTADHWILGSEYFWGRRVLLDLAARQVTDVTESKKES